MATQLDKPEAVSMPDPEVRKARWEYREEMRQRNKEIAREAAQRRSRGSSLPTRIEDIRRKLESANVVTTVALIEQASERDRDLYLLAEEFGQNRVGVLGRFGAPRAAAREAFKAVAGLGVPTESPDSRGEE